MARLEPLWAGELRQLLRRRVRDLLVSLTALMTHVRSAQERLRGPKSSPSATVTSALRKPHCDNVALAMRVTLQVTLHVAMRVAMHVDRTPGRRETGRVRPLPRGGFLGAGIPGAGAGHAPRQLNTMPSFYWADSAPHLHLSHHPRLQLQRELWQELLYQQHKRHQALLKMHIGNASTFLPKAEMKSLSWSWDTPS